MDSLKDALVQATIKEGALNPSNKRFSTKTIAERCGVSEFTLFSLFKTKDALVDEALAVVRNDFVSSAQKSSILSKDVSALVKALIHHAFMVPEYTIFMANYGFWTGKEAEDPKTKQAAFAADVAAAKKAFIFLEDYPDEVVYLLWNYIWRQINYAVEEVYDGVSNDSPEYRNEVAQRVSEGFLSFREEAR